MRHNYPKATMLSLLAICLLSLLIALKSGSVAVGWQDLWQIISGGENEWRELVLKLRLPRAMAALVTGAMLALAGSLMQVLLRNPLADPYIMGVSGGAAFAALGAMLLGVAATFIPVAAFIGALSSILLVFAVSRGSGPWSSTRMLLSGVVLAAGWGALISLILALGPDNSLRGMLFWLMGDLSNASVPLAVWIAFPILLLLLMLRSRSLNILALGEVTAAALGENTKQLGWFIYLLASLLTAMAVSIAGSIGFVGLIIPHAMRLLISSDHRLLLPASALTGGSFLILADTLARTVAAPLQLPVGVITALTGVPLFLYLLHRARVQT
ncbi:MAG: iron ABC transporter permease [Proteobacteria bacterium]|nr:iron ABC transporter permease [Pseudomonadota bacterium]